MQHNLDLKRQRACIAHHELQADRLTDHLRPQISYPAPAPKHVIIVVSICTTCLRPNQVQITNYM